MRSRPDARVGALVALLALAGMAVPVRAADAAPTRADTERAVEAIKKDPNLAPEKTVRSLKWKGDAPKIKTRNTHVPAWLAWIGDLFLWIGGASWLLMWLVLAALIALLVVFIVKLVRSVGPINRGTRFVAPTHVQDLDIRPESLPPDIGAAARALWDSGEQRAALALLYRGMLSRLAHVHEVPIRDSSTEGDALRLAAQKLDAAQAGYATLLVRTWQRAIYGGLPTEDSVVHELCAGFAANLDPPSEEPRPRASGFAPGHA